MFKAPVFLHFIRALFPNWNFFESIGYAFEVEFRQAGSQEWEPLVWKSSRSLFGLLVNVDCNIKLAQINVIEHFARDVQELQVGNDLLCSQKVQELTSFKLLRSLIQMKLSEYLLESKTIQFQVLGSNYQEKVLIYVSDWLSLESR